MVDLICEQEHQDFFCKNLSSQRTCVSNSTTLTLAQPKLKASNFWLYVTHRANDYVKEKEKNMTTLAVYHGVLLVTVGNYLRNDIATSIKQITKG